MDAIISSLQSIPKPSFLRQQQQQQQNKSVLPPPKQPDKVGTGSEKHVQQQQKHRASASSTSKHMNANDNPFQKLNDITLLSHTQQSKTKGGNNVDLPALSFTDFAQWDLQPYNQLFVRERLRFRIESNKTEYAKHGIVAQSIPLRLEIKSIQDILIAGGTLSELRMNRQSKRLSVILSYSKIKARPETKLISQLSDRELTEIIRKYNDLRRTTLIKQPCLLCGIYDLYFMQFILCIIKRVNMRLVQQKLFQFLQKSLIYCLVLKSNEKHSKTDVNQMLNMNFDLNLTRDTTLDLLNYEAIHTLLMCISNQCNICYHCMKQYQLFVFDKQATSQNNVKSKSENPDTPNEKWYSQLITTLKSHGFNFKKVIKNSALQHETALMNIYNTQWLDLQQIVMMHLPFQPFQVNATECVEIWCQFADDLLTQYNEMSSKHDSMEKESKLKKQKYSKQKQDEMKHLKDECDNFALEIQLTVFESFLKAVIEPECLHKMIQYLYHKIQHQQPIMKSYDILIMLLFCGHYEGYQYMFKLSKLQNVHNDDDDDDDHHNDSNNDNNMMMMIDDTHGMFKIFESFEVLLSVTNIISSNLKDIGKIIAIRSCLFHQKYSAKYHKNINAALMDECKFEFMQCLKILFYDYGLYDMESDAMERKADKQTNARYKYKKKLPPSIVDKQEQKQQQEEEEKKEEVAKENATDRGDEMEYNLNYVQMMSTGLKTQKKFLMECAYLDCEILQCLLELKLLDESYIVDRFRNTYDFVQYELNVDAAQCWTDLQQKVFVYNKNVIAFRRMKEKDLRMVFRNMIRVVVSKEYRKWIQAFIMNGDEANNASKFDKDMKIQKRTEMEDQYRLPNKVMLLIQSFV